MPLNNQPPLSDVQSICLAEADFYIPITKSEKGHQQRNYWRGSRFIPRTIDALVKHGYLRGDGHDGFLKTRAGHRALERYHQRKLPARICEHIRRVCPDFQLTIEQLECLRDADFDEPIYSQQIRKGRTPLPHVAKSYRQRTITILERRGLLIWKEQRAYLLTEAGDAARKKALNVTEITDIPAPTNVQTSATAPPTKMTLFDRILNWILDLLLGKQ